MNSKEAFEKLESYLHKDSKTPADVFESLHTLWEGAEELKE